MAEVAISVEGARFSYGEREVLKGVTFEVGAARCWASWGRTAPASRPRSGC
jgi:hypothetical protein